MTFCYVHSIQLPGFEDIRMFLRVKRIISHLYFNKSGNLRNSLTLLLQPVITFVPILTGRHESDLNLDLLEPLLEKPT